MKATEGDGRRSVTFLWSAVILTLAVFSIMVTRLVVPRDSLMRATPADAVGYVHSNGYPTAMKTIAGPELPPTLTPDEVAVFWQAGNESVPKKSVLVAWRSNDLPADEKRWFASKSPTVHPIDANTYLIGDEETVDDVLAAKWGKTSLADDLLKSKSLAAVRELLPIQGYMALPAFAADASGDRQELLRMGPEMIFGLSSTDDGSFTAVAEPLERVAAEKHRTKFVLPPTDPHPTKTVVLPDAPLAFSVPAAQIDPLSLLVKNSGNVQAQENDDDAGYSLRRLLAVPFMATLGTDLTDNRAEFVADFPGIQPANLAASLSEYFGGLFPDVRKIVLPDGGSFTEQYVNASRYGVTRHRGEKAAEESLSLSIPEADISYFLKPDGLNGTVITNRAALLSEPLKQPNKQRMLGTPCERLIHANAYPYISIQKSLLGKAKNPLIHKLSALKLVEFGDNSFLICGYPE